MPNHPPLGDLIRQDIAKPQIHREHTQRQRDGSGFCSHRPGIVSRGLSAGSKKDLAVEIIEAEIRSAPHEVWLEAPAPASTGRPVFGCR
jgi:hypothetical protein